MCFNNGRNRNVHVKQRKLTSSGGQITFFLWQPYRRFSDIIASGADSSCEREKPRDRDRVSAFAGAYIHYKQMILNRYFENVKIT